MKTLRVKHPEWFEPIHAHVLHLPEDHVVVKEDFAHEEDQDHHGAVVVVGFGLRTIMRVKNFTDVHEHGRNLGEQSQLWYRPEKAAQVSAQDSHEKLRAKP